MQENDPKRAQAAPGDTYKLAIEDTDFLQSDACRGVRLQLEYMKPEEVMRRKRVVSTVVIFGSARLRSREEAEAGLSQARAAGAGACFAAYGIGSLPADEPPPDYIINAPQELLPILLGQSPGP